MFYVLSIASRVDDPLTVSGYINMTGGSGVEVSHTCMIWIHGGGAKSHCYGQRQKTVTMQFVDAWRSLSWHFQRSLYRLLWLKVPRVSRTAAADTAPMYSEFKRHEKRIPKVKFSLG